MIPRSLRLLLLAFSALLLAGFKATTVPLSSVGQPNDERAAQDGLPQSQSPLWRQLAHCPVRFDNKSGLYSITVAPDVKALDGQTVTAGGFVLPLDGSDKTSHFLLTRRTPVCLFCPPGEPNEVVEVKSKHPITWTDALVTMRGRFALTNDGEKAIFFVLRDAEDVR
jgi:uncharacterized protein